jgi:signal peptidase
MAAREEGWSRPASAARPLVSGRIAALVLLLVAGWWFLAPPALGGQTSYVVTGSSMPDYPPGGLVLVRERDSYGLGDVIAHRNGPRSAPTLGRIVDTSDGRFQVRGDTAALADPSRPTASDVLGSAWLHVPHAATVGRALTTPVGFGLSVVLLLALVIGSGRGGAASRPVRRPVTRLQP